MKFDTGVFWWNLSPHSKFGSIGQQ